MKYKSGWNIHGNKNAQSIHSIVKTKCKNLSYVWKTCAYQNESSFVQNMCIVTTTQKTSVITWHISFQDHNLNDIIQLQVMKNIKILKHNAVSNLLKNLQI